MKGPCWGTKIPRLAFDFQSPDASGKIRMELIGGEEGDLRMGSGCLKMSLTMV